MLNFSYNGNKVILTILFSLNLALSLISFLWDINPLIKVNALLGLIGLIFLNTRIRNDYFQIYIYAVILALSFLVSSLFVWRTDWRIFTPIYFMASGFGMAMILVRGKVYSWGGYIIFYSLSFYFLILMFTGVSGFSALKYCSHNGISIVILIACISLYIILSNENKKISLVPAVFTALISIWGIGRSGIISSLILLFGLFFVTFQAKAKNFFILIIFISYLIYLFQEAFLGFAIDYLYAGNAIENYIIRVGTLEDEVRIGMWSNYFYNLDIFRFVFGVNVVEDPWSDKVINEYNYHNSFISFHSQTGLMGLITIVILIFSLFSFFRTNKVFFFLLLALILRIFTDNVMFFGRFDFIIYFFIFYLLKSVKYKIPHKNPTIPIPVRWSRKT